VVVVEKHEGVVLGFHAAQRAALGPEHKPHARNLRATPTPQRAAEKTYTTRRAAVAAAKKNEQD
jgi:hypothetical protein